MLRRFETLIDPFPDGSGTAPPKTLLAFLLHYSRPALPWLVVMAVLTGIISVIEIVFVSFTGDLIDWLAGSTPSTFFDEHGWKLIAMGVVVVAVFRCSPRSSRCCSSRRSSATTRCSCAGWRTATSSARA